MGYTFQVEFMAKRHGEHIFLSGYTGESLMLASWDMISRFRSGSKCIRLTWRPK